MDEHGIAAALLPLVTAFCRVSICSILNPCTALADSELLGGRRGWQAEGLRASTAARLRADCPLGASQSRGSCSTTRKVGQAACTALWAQGSQDGLEHLREGCSEIGAALKCQLDLLVKLG